MKRFLIIGLVLLLCATSYGVKRTDARDSRDAIERKVSDFVEHLGTGEVFYVDADAPGNATGTSWTNAVLTWDAGNNKCTASRGDVILIAPGHAEDLATASAVALDLIGVKSIGMGEGALRPTFTFITSQDATITMSAASCTIDNMRFIGDVDGLHTGIVVTAASNTIKNCLFQDNGADNCDTWIRCNASADYITIDNCVNDGTDTTTATEDNMAFVSLAGLEHGTVKNCVSHGFFSVANILIATTACTDLNIENNRLENSATGLVGEISNIRLLAASTGWISYNLCYQAADAHISWIDPPAVDSTTVNLGLYENYGVNNSGELGLIIGTVSS